VKPFLKPSAAILSANAVGIIALICSVFLASCNQVDDASTIHATAQGDSVLNSAGILMDKGNLQEAQKLILNALDQPAVNYTPRSIYLFHSLLAEIMYYSALNEQGLQSARTSLRLAGNLSNDTLKGNSYNLMGLIHLNAERYDTAMHYFNRAAALIPNALNKKELSRKDQVLGNISETHLKKGNYAKAIEYARKAQSISIKLNASRAEILNHWVLAETFAKLEQSDSANFHIDKALMHSHLIKYPDVQLFVLSTAIAFKPAPLSEVYLVRGIKLSDSLKYNDFAVTSFLKNAVKTLINKERFKEASQLQQKLAMLQESIRNNREELNMKLLDSYYKKENEAAIDKAILEQKNKELGLNRIILLSLATLIFFLVISIMYYRRWVSLRRKTEKLEFEKEKDTLRQEQELKLMQDRYASVEAERNRIARELHDDIGSSMSSISIFADLAQKELSESGGKALELVERIKHKTQEVSENISDLIWAIYSKNDTWRSLIERIRNFGFELLTAKGIEVKITDDFRLHEINLPIEYKKNLLLFFKEAFNNIAKYSEAKRVDLSIKHESNTLKISISDNGKGFDIATVRKGNGLNGFQARAASVKGNFKWHSAPGQGTTLTMEIPFDLG
jgi:two-component system sensor histidine kinase UhpB